MKAEALTRHLEDLSDDEVADIYEEPDPKLLRRFNASTAEVQDLIEQRFPDSIEQEAEEEDEGEDDGEDGDDTGED